MEDDDDNDDSVEEEETYGKDEEKYSPAIDGCIKRGITKEAGEKIFDQIICSGKYAFMKSHAAAYAAIAYHTAYLKAYYPTEFSEALKK